MALTYKLSDYCRTNTEEMGSGILDGKTFSMEEQT